MPHVEIKYSDDLILDTKNIFDDIEKTINQADSGAGVCKSRAYACSEYKYTHVLLTVNLLTKPHRDETFTNNLSEELKKTMKKYFTKSLYFSLDIQYSGSYYYTDVHLLEGDTIEVLKKNKS